MPIFYITQERRVRMIWRIQAGDAQEAIEKIREGEIADDEEFIDAEDYEVRSVQPGLGRSTSDSLGYAGRFASRRY
jgi:hypothetical protein